MPPALIAVALGLALASGGPRRRWMAVALFVAAATFASRLPWPDGWLDGVFLAGWASVIASAACVHLPARPRLAWADPLAMIGGVWAGAMIELAGAPTDLLKAAPWVLLAWPAAGLIDRRAGIAVKVLASWLIAVAALAAALPFLPVTPGYLPDHLD